MAAFSVFDISGAKIQSVLIIAAAGLAGVWLWGRMRTQQAAATAAQSGNASSIYGAPTTDGADVLLQQLEQIATLNALTGNTQQNTANTGTTQQTASNTGTTQSPIAQAPASQSSAMIGTPPQGTV